MLLQETNKVEITCSEQHGRRPLLLSILNKRTGQVLHTDNVKQAVRTASSWEAR